MFKEYVKYYGLNHSDEELILDFNNGLVNEVIACIYEKNYAAFREVSRQFSTIDEATKDSCIVEQIWRALQNYDPQRSEAKLVTVICTYIRYGLLTIVQADKTNKRKVNAGTNRVLLSELELEEDRLEETGELDSHYIEMEMIDLIESLDLTQNQKEYCRCIIEQSCELTMAQIAQHIGISRAGALSVRKALQEKLNILLD